MDNRLDLAAERHIAIRDRGVLYQFTLQPITAERWQKYFDGVVSTTETRGREQVNVLDASTAMIELVTEALISATGYKTPDSKPLTEIPGWPEKIPSGHRLAIGQVLASAQPSDLDGEAVAIGGDRVVVIDAMWNADDNGTIALHRGLVHNFAEPTFEHERRYRRDSSRSKVVGGSRTGKTVWLGVQKTLIAIYDELIRSVEGYSYGGSELGNAGRIAQYMDAYHKVVAARQLFAQAGVEE